MQELVAFLDGSDYVGPNHLLKVVPDVLGHRLILSYEAMLDKIDARDVALKVAQKII